MCERGLSVRVWNVCASVERLSERGFADGSVQRQTETQARPLGLFPRVDYGGARRVSEGILCSPPQFCWALTFAGTACVRPVTENSISGPSAGSRRGASPPGAPGLCPPSRTEGGALGCLGPTRQMHFCRRYDDRGRKGCPVTFQDLETWEASASLPGPSGRLKKRLPHWGQGPLGVVTGPAASAPAGALVMSCCLMA